MQHQLWADQQYGHPALLCGNYGNLKEHQMFFLKCEGIICDTVPSCLCTEETTVKIHMTSPTVWMSYI